MQSIKYLNASDGTANASLMTVQTLRSPGATTILVNTVTGVHATGFHATMGAPHTFTDPVTGETITIISDATAVDFAGHINAGQIIIDAIAPGYVDTRGSLVGDIIIIRPISEWSNNVANVLAAGALNDDGTLSKTASNAFYQAPELVFDHIVAGTGVWAGLGYGSTLTASMTALTCYINGLRNTVPLLATRTFTASKDTYVDVLYSSTGVGTLVYTEVANNAASPALAANSIRVAIVVSSANIAAAASINQGQETALLPIASSVSYTVTDSLGNLICPRDPNRKMLGYRRLGAAFNTATAGSYVSITGLTIPFIAPGGRKVKVTFSGTYSGTGYSYGALAVLEGATVIAQDTTIVTSESPFSMSDVATPSAGLHTYQGSLAINGGSQNIQYGNGAYGARWPANIIIELE